MIRMIRISKKYYLRQIVACWLMCYMLFCFGMPVRVAMADPAPGALPDGFVLVAGTGSPGTIGNTMLIQNISNGAIFRWDGGFNIGELATVNFDFSTAGSSVLNRDVTGNMSEIYGNMIANGNVWIVNPAGIVFGGGAAVNVAQLVASSLDIDDADFMNGLPYTFTGGLNAGDVINEGTITAERIALIGKTVLNTSALNAENLVIMAAGDTVTISEVGSSVGVKVTVTMPDQTPGEYTYKVDNGGENGTGGVDAQHVVLAAGDIWSSAYITAYDSGDEAEATINIKAAGNVSVTNQVVASATSHSEGGNAVATVTVDAGGDLDVITEVGSTVYASLKAEARDGYTNNAEVFICADNVKVEADLFSYESPDGYFPNNASIEAIATGGDSYNQSNIAAVTIGAKKGVEVVSRGYWGVFIAEAWIGAEATNADENAASVFICSQDDVLVTAEADGIAKINSLASSYSGSSEATTTVISHEGEVLVSSLPGGVSASIESVADSDYGYPTAITDVYGKDVVVTGRSAAIMMTKDGYPPKQRGDGYSLSGPDSDDGPVMEEDGDSLLLIDSSDNADVDCPDCPRDDEELFAPVAPIPFWIPRVEGCPELTLAASIELGIAPDTIQVAIGNALALNPNIQPCQACASLVNAAAILRDEDGSRMAAMVQVFNTLAPADAPFTPEMATSIAMAFGGVAEGTQYASVMEYIDAFVQYATVLDIELGSPTGDSVAFVMEKYGAGITGSDNGNIAAFVATRLAAIGG